RLSHWGLPYLRHAGRCRARLRDAASEQGESAAGPALQTAQTEAHANLHAACTSWVKGRFNCGLRRDATVARSLFSPSPARGALRPSRVEGRDGGARAAGAREVTWHRLCAPPPPPPPPP